MLAPASTLAQETASHGHHRSTITEQLDRLDELEASPPCPLASCASSARSPAPATTARRPSFDRHRPARRRASSTRPGSSGKTVTGQARAAAEDVASTARTGAATVAGQAKAQGRRVSKKASSEATGLIDSAIDTVESDLDKADRRRRRPPRLGHPVRAVDQGRALERAKELDIDGPTRMSKAELIKALRTA